MFLFRLSYRISIFVYTFVLCALFSEAGTKCQPQLIYKPKQFDLCANNIWIFFLSLFICHYLIRREKKHSSFEMRIVIYISHCGSGSDNDTGKMRWNTYMCYTRSIFSWCCCSILFEKCEQLNYINTHCFICTCGGKVAWQIV